MSRQHLLSVSALLVVAFATTISAQQQPARPTAAQPTASAPTVVNLPNGRMAVIDTNAFLESKTGIAKFGNAVTKLNDEFKKVKDDITATQTRAQALETEINAREQSA